MISSGGGPIPGFVKFEVNVTLVRKHIVWSFDPKEAEALARLQIKSKSETLLAANTVRVRD